jgi:hypothetical protein
MASESIFALKPVAFRYKKAILITSPDVSS